MNSDEIKKRIILLRSLIEHHNSLYYQKDAPEIFDHEYDRLFKELVDLEKNYPEFDSASSPTKKVGGEPLPYFEKFSHTRPMLSLDSIYSDSELISFDSRIKKQIKGNIDYICELKLDGLSVEVQYQNGGFIAGATRGDGYTGENVTSNIKTIKNLPLTLKPGLSAQFLALRGEVIMPVSGFEKLNTELKGSGKAPFANCRNAAAGSLRLLDPRITFQRPLLVYFYDILVGPVFDTHLEELEFLKSINLPVVPHYVYCRDVHEAIAYKNKIGPERDKMDLEIDGLVVKLNQIRKRSVLGEKERSPRWAIALKFSPAQAVTKIKKIVFQVGRTGIITPVADLEPVRIRGANIKRVSLHNFDYIKEKDIHLNDSVIIQRAGDVIPEVVRILDNERDGSQTAVPVPLECPECASSALKHGAYIYCTAPMSCPSQILFSISHYASKNGMNIVSLSSETIKRLIKYKLIMNISDLYHIKFCDLINIPNFGKKSADNLINSIAASKVRPLANFIFALGIRGVGLHISNIIAEEFGDFNSFAEADAEKLLSIKEIGEIVSKNIIAFFDNETNTSVIKRLFESGVKPYIKAKSPVANIKGFSFLITGTLDRYTRNEAHEKILELGGMVHSTLTKKTDYIIVGKNPGSKLSKAKQLNTKILTEEQFLKMIN